MTKVLFYLIIPVLILSGCASYPIRSDIPHKLEILRTQVVPGKTARTDLTNKFGEPFISNDQFRVDVYRVLVGSDLILDGPLIPVSWDRQEIVAYALIVYDEHSIVKDIDWGIYHAGDEFDKYPKQTASLVADGFYFESFRMRSFYPRTEVLFARISDSQMTLHSIAPQGMCLLHIAPGDHVYKIILDTEVLASYLTDSAGYSPLLDAASNRGWVLGFITILIPMGEHTLSMVTRYLKPSEFDRKLSCYSGESLYAYSNIEKFKSTDKFTWETPYRYRGEIVVVKTIPEAFESRRLILYHRDRWLAPDIQ